MAQTVGVGQFMNRLGRGAMHESGAIRCLEPSNREYGHTLMRIGFSEHKVEVWCVEIGIRNTEQP